MLSQHQDLRSREFETPAIQRPTYRSIQAVDGMFSTFGTAQDIGAELANHNATNHMKLKASGGRACEPCRRSKIRCSGEYPCEGCRWYHRATICRYTEPRKTPRRSKTKISQVLQEHRSILQKLLPDFDLNQLKDLPREELVELVQTRSSARHPLIETRSTEEKMPGLQLSITNTNQLDRTWGYRPSGLLEQASEVLNANMGNMDLLLASAKQNSTYLGISPVLSVMRVIARLDPGCFSKTEEGSSIRDYEAKEAVAIHVLSPDNCRADIDSKSDRDEISLINAYFTYVHPFIPLIEEQVILETYLGAQRTDSRWLLLLNSILAVGSIGASKAGDFQHHIYFDRAKQHLNTEVLTSIHLETVQALAILSGFYLHYIQLPNQANSLMEATQRVATMLRYGSNINEAELADPKPRNKLEIRRETLAPSAWGDNTCENPYIGRRGYTLKTVPPLEPYGLSVKMPELAQQNIWLSVITTRMYDALAVSPLLKEHERHDLDTLHLEWYGNSTVRRGLSPEKVKEPLVAIMENVMRWRYFTNRILLYRPVLLWYAMQHITWENLSDEKKTAIEVCRELCTELIHDIDATWRGADACQMSGWHATWSLYQATMVLLVSLYSHAHEPDAVGSCQKEVEDAICTMKDLQSWCPTVLRSLEVIITLYNRSKRQLASLQGQARQVCSLDATDRSASSATLEYHAHFPPTNLSHPTSFDVSMANTNYKPQSLSLAYQELYRDNSPHTLNRSSSWESLSPDLQPQPSGWQSCTTQSWPGALQAGNIITYGYHENVSQVLEMNVRILTPADFMR